MSVENLFVFFFKGALSFFSQIIMARLFVPLSLYRQFEIQNKRSRERTQHLFLLQLFLKEHLRTKIP